MTGGRDTGRTPGRFPPLSSELVERYLAVLGVERVRPGLAALRRLVRAHLYRVPFENISKITARKRSGASGLPGLEAYLDGVAEHRLGGTCYANNFHLYTLLANLGYRVRLCGAAMSRPDVHLVSLVELEGRRFLVDVGYAAPFDAPLPCDLGADHVVRLGRDRYTLSPPDSRGRLRLQMHRDGEPMHGYTVDPAPRRIEEFAPVIADSYRDEATFMNEILLARFFPGRSLVVRNLQVIESEGTAARLRTLADRDELVGFVAEGFGIPERITRDAIADAAMRGDTWT